MYKTWLEIDRRAAAHNVRAFRKLLSQGMSFPRKRESKIPRLWAVVKSNAYGHGLILFSKFLDKLEVDGFCVDSVIEGLKLRQNGLKKPILVLGPTLNQERYLQAKKTGIAVTISTFESLRMLGKLGRRAPEFHIKIDTGMHRQGFIFHDLEKVVKQIKNQKSKIKNFLKGIYTHFAEPTNHAFTDMQFERFADAVTQFERAGFTNLIHHAAATGGVLASAHYHLDAVRVGAGLYGFLPSQKTRGYTQKLSLRPVLSWRAVISEIKEIPKGEWIGYDRKFKTSRRTTLAVVPIGYWHGLDRRAFPGGEVLVRGARVPIVGNVSMDIVTIDVTGIRARAGDVVTLIGRNGKEMISAQEHAKRCGTTAYESLTRLNPLIERIV